MELTSRADLTAFPARLAGHPELLFCWKKMLRLALQALEFQLARPFPKGRREVRPLLPQDELRQYRQVTGELARTRLEFERSCGVASVDYPNLSYPALRAYLLSY